jgi:hypothetical protein
MTHNYEYDRIQGIMASIQLLIRDDLPHGAQGEMVNAIAALRRAQGHLDT